MNDIFEQVRRENKLLKEYIKILFYNQNQICSELVVDDALFYCNVEQKHVVPSCDCKDCEADCSRVGVFEEIWKWI